MTRHAPLRAAAGTALVMGAFLVWLCARRIIILNDEGIYLDGALRILRGEVPYRDFFILMGPGTFWLEALAFKAFGVSVAASRVVMIADLTLIAACVCWLVARWTQPAYAVWVAVMTIFFVISDPGLAVPNHRWDSAACAMAAAMLVIVRGRPALAFAAGVCSGFAVWITPSVALVGIALLGWLLFSERDRVFPFLLGIAAVSAVCASVLAWQHALVPMLQQMFWTGSNYGGANYMPYGSRCGGYAALFEGGSAAELPARILVVAGLTIPAILPPLALAFCGTRAARANREVLIFAIAGLALLLAAYPRMDVPHLAYATPFFCALAAFHGFRIPSKLARPALFLTLCILAVIPMGYNVLERINMIPLHTRVGDVVAPVEDAALIRGLERVVGKDQPVFCFPYLPVYYFLTLGRNPTRFSYLQPGLMTDADERSALAELAAHPPPAVIYQNVTPQMILRIWPHTDPSRLRLRRLESYLGCAYHPGDPIHYRGGELEILERNPQSVAGACDAEPGAPAKTNAPASE